jgi:hypothetical protein
MCSKEGGQAGAPLTVLGCLFILSYFLTRRARLAFVIDRESTETSHGSLPEASALMRTMTKLYRVERETRQTASCSVRDRSRAGFVGGWHCYDFLTVHLAPADQCNARKDHSHGDQLSVAERLP